MDQDSFTQRLLQRASLNRNSDGALKPSKQASRRRYNIIKAINEPSIPSLTEISSDDNNNVSSYIVEPKPSETLVMSDDSEMPIMESTRKFANLDSTRIVYSPSSLVTSTISTIDMIVKAGSLDQTYDSKKIRAPALNDTAVYDKNNFLKVALGDELNNTSVTYDDSSASDRSNSDFDASDLMSKDEYSMGSSVVRAQPIAEMQPRSSSTLNTSMKLNRLVLEKTFKTSSERVSKLRAFFRLLRKFLQDFKKVIGFRAFSKS